MHSRASSQPSLQQDEQQASDDIMATTSAAVDPHDFHAVVSQDTDSDDNDSSVSVSSCSKKRCRETTVVSSSRRRSPRRHRRRKETEEEEVDEAQTSITLTTNNSHTNREPLFSRLLSPHQQAAIFSPAVRTPHDKKKRRQASDTPGTSSGAKTTNSILRKDATKDNVATNLAQTMEDANTAAPKTTFLQQISSNTPTTIDQHALRYRMSILYPPSKYPALEHKPCILPRIMACYTLHKDYQQEQLHHLATSAHCGAPSERITTRRRKLSMDGNTMAIQNIQPIREFINALVDLEWNLLDDPHDAERDPPSTNKRVHFAAFDGSSLCPPSDVTENSHQQQDTCIRNLLHILHLVDTMGQSHTSLVVLQDLISYLDNEFRLFYHDKACAGSISNNSATSTKSYYPTRRVEKAAALYSRDLESILDLWKSHGNKDTLGTTDNAPVFLTWQCRLADVASQLIRFWLRTLMNPVPGRADMKNKTQRWQERFVDIVDLTGNSSSAFLLPDGTDTKVEQQELSTAIEDGSLSSILSDALSHIYDYLGGIPLCDDHADKSETWRRRLLQVLPTETCCTSERCQSGIGNGRKPALPLSDQEWKDVGDELQVASDFFAFYHRVLFLEQLVQILLNAGGWATQWESTVQSAAQHLVVLHRSVKQWSGLKNDNDDSSLLPVIQQEDAHLVLLGLPLSELLDRLQEDILPICKERYATLRSNYQTTVAAFKLGKANTLHKKKYQPQVGELEVYWNDLFAGTVFPSIAMTGGKEENKGNA